MLYYYAIMLVNICYFLACFPQYLSTEGTGGLVDLSTTGRELISGRATCGEYAGGALGWYGALGGMFVLGSEGRYGSAIRFG